MTEAPEKEVLLHENEHLRTRLEELEETLRAIRSGEVDALVVSRPEGEQIFTLKGALEPYRIMVENMSEGAVTLAQDGTISYSNAQFAGLVRTQLDQVIGQPLHHWIAPPDRDKFAAMLVRGRKEIVREELVLQTSGGKSLPAQLSMCPLPESGGKGIAAVITDLTEVASTAEAWARLAMIVDSSDDAIISTSLEGTVESWNKAAERLFGYTAEEAVGRPIHLLIAPPARAGEITQKLEAIRLGEHTGHVETVRLRKDGSQVDVSASASPIKDAMGRVAGMSLILRDISARRRIEESLRESEEKFRYVFDQSPIGKSITLPSGEIHVNRAFCEMLGYSEDELQHRRWQDVTHPDDIEASQAELAPLLAGERGSARFIKRYLHKDGRVVWADVSTSLRRDGSGKPLYFMTHVMDITERKRAEEELRTASAYARSLIEASLDPLVTISTDGKITDVNEATVQATGVAREALIGSDFSDYFTEPDKARAGYQEVFAKGRVTDYPLTLRHVSGKVTEVLYNASVYRDKTGGVAGVFAAARDITERRRAEEELRAASAYARSLIEASLDPLVTISTDGKITDVNEATVQATGVARETLIGSDFSDYFTEPDKARTGYQEVFAKGQVTDYPLTLRNVSGQFKEVLYNASVYRNRRGEVTGIFAAARDITERRRAEGELRRYHAQLEEMVRERTAQLEAAYKDLEGFAYSVSHDLRTPLRAIDGFSHQVLKRYADTLDDEGKRYLTVVRDNTKKMGQLIDDILAFSRMGRVQMSEAEVGMDELAHEVFDELKAGFAVRELAVEIKPLPPCRGDQSMLRQVWVNLLGNAVKFTKYRTAAKVEVGGSTEGAEHIYYVRDNGAGYDMQYADKLFGVFQRLHSNEEFEGSGIGLAIVKRIVTRHGGRVWAEGKVNEGATFYFALPV